MALVSMIIVFFVVIGSIIWSVLAAVVVNIETASRLREKDYDPVTKLLIHMLFTILGVATGAICGAFLGFIGFFVVTVILGGIIMLIEQIKAGLFT